MRHRKAGRRLGRTTAHRKATVKNMAVALFTHNAIETTLAKSKELRGFAEPLITMAKKDTVYNRRRAFAALRDKSAVRRLCNETGPAFASGWSALDRGAPETVSRASSFPVAGARPGSAASGSGRCVSACASDWWWCSSSGPTSPSPASGTIRAGIAAPFTAAWRLPVPDRAEPLRRGG